MTTFVSKSLYLHPKQMTALVSQATEILFGGAAGGGKSHLMRAMAISFCYEIPGLQAYIFRRTSPDLWKNHMEGPAGFPALLGEWIEKRFCMLNLSKGFIEFWNGSKIHLCHCQYEKDVYQNYQGPEIHLLLIDELTQWIKPMYAFLRSRVRLGGLQIPEKWKGLFPRIMCGANPGGIGHTWVKGSFIDIAEPLSITKMPKARGGLKRQFIPSLLEDNPTLLKNDPDYEDRLNGLGNESLVKAMRWGIWDIIAGGAIDDVWSRARHVIEPFEIPKQWKVFRGFDWGSSKPFAVLWFAVSDGAAIELKDGRTVTFPKDTVFIVREYYGIRQHSDGRFEPDTGCKMTATEVAKEIKAREEKMPFKVKPGPADSSIFDSDNTIAADMKKAGIKWTLSDKRPGSRKTGLEKLRQVLKAGLESPMEEPGLFVFSTCIHTIRTVPVLPRDPKDPEDADTKAEDHIYDTIRYFLTTKRPGGSMGNLVGV